MSQDYDLKPQYDSAKSFYGKARVRVEDNGDKALISYNTKVAEIRGGQLFIHGWFSVTTARHINEFMRQHGHDSMAKKDMDAYINPDERHDSDSFIFKTKEATP